MKRNYTIASAKAMITRNRGKIKGKQIIFSGPGPGIKVWGATDFLKAAGYSWHGSAEPKLKSAGYERITKAMNKATEAFRSLGKALAENRRKK